jgi:hypothetical protein
MRGKLYHYDKNQNKVVDYTGHRPIMPEGDGVCAECASQVAGILDATDRVAEKMDRRDCVRVQEGVEQIRQELLG